MVRGVAILLIVLFAKRLVGQCPDRGFLWHRITYLRDSATPKVPFEQQLNELVSYLNKTNKCSNSNDSAQALLLQRIGWLHTYQKDFFTAIQYTLKSIALINGQKNNPSINPRHVIKSYYNLQILYDSLKLETKKSAAIDSCISIGIKLHSGYDYVINSLGRKVPQLFANGDYYACIYYAKLGESIALENKTTIGNAEDFETRFFSWRINSLNFLNRTTDAEKLVIDKISQYEKQSNTKILGSLYGSYGQVNKDKGDAEKALYYFKRSFDYNKKIQYDAGCAEALNNIGFTYSTSLHQNKMAITYYFKALNFADANESLNILDNIANIYVHDRKYDSAFNYFQKSFDQLRPGFTETDLLKNDYTESSGITEYVTGMVLDKAEAWLSNYNTTGSLPALEEAIRIYQVADRYFDKLKASQSEIQSKLFWKTNNRRLYEHAIEACYANHNAEKAFYFFEKSRSVLLNDQIMEQRRMDDRDLAKHAQLKKNILEIETKLQNAALSSKDNIALQQQLFTNKHELEILIKSINSKYPSYAQNVADTNSLTLELVKKKILNDNRSLLEIFTGDSAIYVLSVTTGHTSFIKLNKRLYDSLTTAYISFVDNAGKLNQDFPGFVNISHQLYELIFQDIQLQAAGSLIISPDGKSFPFEALITNTNSREPQYLLSQYATSYTYSAKYLTNQFAVNTKTPNNVLGMAPVQYKNYQNLSTLYGSDNSLENISNFFSNVTNYVLENATKNNFIENFPRYNIIQLYTHASDSSVNNDPVIYFADSALYLSALIPRRKPVTQLVILSACETANGRLYEGEGIFSFNRGFAALGIPAAVSNLWSVDNESTYRITELFYKYLSQGLPTDVALQKAKLEFINSSSSIEKKLPYFWAASILTGKVDTIKNNPGFPWKELAAATILILAIVYVTRKVLRRR